MHKRRYIVHADMDAFFAAIEQRDNPAYRSRPVVVGADPKGGKGRGVVSTCSYEARRFGIHSAMPISLAWRKCPKAVFLPPDMEKYGAVSCQIYDILYSFTPDIEPVGIDEAFLDITGSHHLFGTSTSLGTDGEHGRTIGTPLQTCRLIKSRIKEKIGLTVSIGLGPTMMAAKIASDLKKPDGLVEVTQLGLLDFLWPLEVGRIWGLGKKAEEELARIGVKTIGDLAVRDPEELASLFGKSGLHYWQLANGIDERCVEPGGEAKSIGSETTFDEDTSSLQKISAELMSLCEKISGRLRQEKLKCRTLTVKIRLEGFHTYTRSITLDLATNFVDVLYKEAKGLYNNFDKKLKRVRLIGVRASSLVVSGLARDLFEDIASAKQESVHKAIDRIKEKFGDGSIYHATDAEGHS